MAKLNELSPHGLVGVGESFVLAGGVIRFRVQCLMVAGYPAPEGTH